MVREDLGKMIRRLREKKGWSTQRLAEKANISGSYLNRIEVGERKRPTLIVLEDLANALEINITELLQLTHMDDKELISLDELFLSNEITVNGTETLSADVKEDLLKVIDIIFMTEWQKETLVDDMYEVMKAISELKEAM